MGRDPVRTPMPWDASANADFTTAKPWLPLNADWPTRNVARMAEDPHSILTLYCRLLVARRAHLALRSAISRHWTPRATCSRTSAGTVRID